MYHIEPPCNQHHAPDTNFFIECVIVCHKFSDFLRYTLPNNKQFFDRIVIVTSPEDKATQKLCEFYHVECVATENLRTAEGQFCKGAGINAGLERLSKRGWVLHMDADIWLPPQFRGLLAWAHLDPQMIYGIDRFSVPNVKAWQAFLNVPKLQHECGSYIHLHTSGFPVATRVMQQPFGGYVPIGFFQLWNPGTSGVHAYPQGHTNAGREDTLFANYWPRNRRSFIPEIIGYHLESGPAVMGVNWGGRKTPEFILE
jgi:hypothetical protein